MTKYKARADNYKNLAAQRIVKLFSEAQASFAEYPQLSKRYIVLARRLSTRYKVRLNPDQKKVFCKQCSAYLKNSVNSRIRLSSGLIVQTCLECGAVKRMRYKK